MVEKLTWKKLVWELVFFYAPWVFVGWIFGYLPWLLLAATVLQLGWHLHNQMRLSAWLWDEKRLTPPSGSGNWESLFNGIYRMQQRQRRKRKELTNLIRRFRNGAESLPDAVVVFRGEGNIVWCNKLAQYLLGFRWPDDSGQPISNLIRTPDFIKYLNKQDFSEPLEMPSPLNVERMLELRIVPYTEGEHLMVVRDVTQLKQLEGMRRNFFANVSHELRTPMTVLQGYLEMTEDPDMIVGPMWTKAHGVMTEQLNRMNSLVNQLLTLSKIEAAPMHELDEVVNVPAMLEVLEKEAASLSGDCGHKLEFDIDTSLRVLADEDQLRSAISNLVYNAVKYTPPGATVRVRWYQTSQGACLDVSDTGDGIEPQHLHRLTERFYRVDKARSRDTGGSGLGLAIVKHALSHHDSHLEIQSELGVGSRFHFTLPNRLTVS
ncbi:phosphate regulon sensor histidine kinase PhoR [Vibrio kanaloae]|uniref:Phosphate regulon sensor protein PhoR n=1 Tax=Vibrio kanaloae TaxID=170673 RepID=A0A4U1WTS4_9VIBR|nr:phosphate regulon sensor histidine kinase PhoR [Vibrio kanaloae]TKE96713.1 phosphate regulon sensor histidine kinase PhoR [Vibrio kanaloae]TKF13468.1 phosphate regulon sensor histidine kinase PhoR [Vibrio kanaloae]TKF26001.1 phosphate regulon sensor histidine kinase PhoR [Vibrio kanaloae]TKF37335.1 phosphate regulon sensor histidine kinase PhoR [Vibrio kanaloae]TKF78826.1 phosphate regulon sensor histidine kinase PhoR [Vibrio kanaloae]